MRTLFFMTLTLFFSLSVQAQKAAQNTCSATCTVDPTYETIEKVHYIFTGTDTTGLNVTSTKITILEGRKQLVKKWKSKDCQSVNPADCMVEVMEEIPPVTMNLYTLPNKDVTDQYEIRNEKVIVMKTEGGQVETNVVCPKNMTQKLLKKVQEGLIKLGYPLVVNGKMDQETKLSMIDFQKSKNIPYGELTLATLAALNVK